MATFRWFDGEVPENIKITQVYGLVFSKDGRMLMRIEDGKYSLAGGTPESYDANKIATLKRELIEEVNTTIYEPIMVGYQLVNEENGTPPYAQVRMTAIIDTVGSVKPDPDTGKTYQRLLTSPSRVIDLLGWGEVGKLQVEAATRVAKDKLGITTYLDKEEYV
jgi:hypothetical protein